MKSDNHWKSMGRNAVSTLRPFKSSSSACWIGIAALATLIAGFITTRHFGPHLRELLANGNESLNSHQLAVAGIWVSAICITGLGLLSGMILVKARVHNSRESVLFSKHDVPGFVHQDRESAALLRFRQHVEDIVRVDDVDSLSTAVALRHWVRCQQSEAKAAWETEKALDHENPHVLLEELRAGEPGACRRFSYTLLGALLSAGFDARFVVFASRLRRRGALFHAVVEVWIEGMNQWVLLDPTYDCIVLINGRVASAIDLLLAVASGDPSCIAFDRNGSVLKPFPKVHFLAECCQHLFLALSNAVFDGYGVRIIGPKRIDFLHYCPRGAKYPGGRKQILLGIIVGSAALTVVVWTLSLVAWCLE